MYSYVYYPDYLYHHGIKGMKWGVRRFQNRDGSLTSAGQRRRDRGEQESTGERSRSNGGSKSTKSGRLKKVLGTTLGVAAAAGAGYLGGKYLGKKIVNNPKALDAIKNLRSRAGSKAAKGLTSAVNAYDRAGNAIRGKARNAGLRARTLSDRARSAFARGKQSYYENGGASGLASKARYGAGYAQGTASRVGKSAMTKARNAGLRARTLSDRARGAFARGKQSYYENGGASGLASKARRAYTTAGGARGIASGVTGRVKSAARYGVGKARYAAGYAQGTGRRAVNGARNAAGSALYRGAQVAGKARNAANNAYVKRRRRRNRSWVWAG